ncbi:tripartite tricarboxylate transporter TctB family protein [Lacicoccus alkaliphilus]|uniref:Tripartite tricarboxylate transporter TctB family protein n=1 Tax=Lacicoccus alkaliphilus DSM 16010 TaxID=1123231 RepID=A0A1M7JX64_9BACL|nr:tripartite tricarboxylate transporter TctB family protein [Salinicoccus alkaliphilus]SHM57511.1 Tripartite tricarboxylate transporter TctB family protein [Salinicoccus alkaliphilus DSM 16010]
MRNIGISIVIILLSVFLFYDTFSIEAAASEEIGPTMWPRILLISLFIFGFILLIHSLYRLKKDSGEKSGDRFDAVKFWGFLILIIMYIPALIYIGFIIATPIWIFMLAFIAGMRKVLPLMLTPLVGTAVVTFLFPVLLRISMPRGVGFMREVSYFFY